MISKNILKPNFVYSDEYGNSISRSEMCDLIDRWKYVLLSYGAERGNSLGISLVRVNPNHVALVIAAGELGMKLILLDKPVLEDTIDRTKAAIFSPIDFHVVDEYLEENTAYMKMVEAYCKINIRENAINLVTNKVPEIIPSTEDDVYLCGSTSGTTGIPKPVYYTQKDCYDLAIRNARVFDFKQDSKICHTRNMHHVSSMLTFLLPSLLTSDRHYYYNIYNDTANFPRFMQQEHITHSFFGSKFVVDDFVANTSTPFETTIKINLSGFTIPENYVDICKNLNVEFYSHYGSVDTGVPLLLNKVTKDSIYQKDWLGKKPDDYYDIDVMYDGILVKIPGKGYNMVHDNVEEIDGTWYLNTRRETNPYESGLREETNIDLNIYDKHIVIWDDKPDLNFQHPGYKIHYLDKKTWTTETKINVYQLRGYLNKL
jgi:acyl-coenzyme A synthetase/AMP-(fatty) acid ligase